LAQDEDVARSAKPTDSQKAAGRLRKIAALTTGLPEDSPADAKTVIVWSWLLKCSML